MAHAQARVSLAQAPQSCVARQPIFDAQRRVFAYELLFRPSFDATACNQPSSWASAKVIEDSLLAIGLDALLNGRRAFVNVTRDILVSGIPTLLPPEVAVLELTEDIHADAEVLSACARLRSRGYQLALDDYVLNEGTAALLPYADYVKIDVLAPLEERERRDTLTRIRRTSARLVAEKVETPTHLDDARRDGFSYFQGYFLGRPTLRKASHVPARRLGYLELMVRLSEPDLTVPELEALVKHDVSLTYRILRAVNSAAMARRVEIRSIQQAIVLLGMDSIRRWATVWAIAGVSDPAQTELVASSIIRARCCELLASSHGGDTTSAFILGMCSQLDGILEQPMEVVLAPLPITDDVRAALCGERNARRKMLDCVVAYEHGQWDECEVLAREAGFDVSVLPTAYHEALIWTRDLRASSK
jgi:EAL and modified HD-GYP domain-containing signal transduction protein